MKPGIKHFLLLLIFSALCSHLFAQDVLTGRVYENKAKVFLQDIRVENLKTHVMTSTHVDGSFTIAAKVGDVIAFTNSNYKPDTLFLTDLKYVQIFLDPKQTQLPEVQVQGQQIKESKAGFTAQPIQHVFGVQSLTYQTDNDRADGDNRIKGGVSLALPDVNRARANHDKKVTREEQMKERIVRTFSEDTLKKYLPLKGQEMQNFIILYTPDIDTFYDPGFNLQVYLNANYQEFMKIPEDERKSKSLTQLTPKGN